MVVGIDFRCWIRRGRIGDSASIAEDEVNVVGEYYRPRGGGAVWPCLCF